MGIGPSTKETSLHHFKDPLVDVLSNDKNIDLVGVLVFGTSDINEHKQFVSDRVAKIVQASRVDGVVISTDGWGNSHVDFENLFKKLGKLQVNQVGLTFAGKTGNLVVSNKYMDTIINIAKNKEGTESEIVGENTINKIDAVRAKALLKQKMNTRD